MRWLAVVTLLLIAYLPAPALARGRTLDEARGDLVSVAVTVDTRTAPLYAAPGTADRWYLEAREGSTYALQLTNRTPERLGLRVTVDGLDVISGDRAASNPRGAGRGRLYVLDAWERMTVRGWRTSLRDVRRFTFVDEEASYAARSGKANSRMGWIEVAVLRERERPPRVTRKRGLSAADESRQRPRHRSYPGTGWGSRVTDRATLVHFDAEGTPAEKVVLRYEYRETLCALGILPSRRQADRLLERERGELGFARPPKW